MPNLMSRSYNSSRPTGRESTRSIFLKVGKNLLSYRHKMGLWPWLMKRISIILVSIKDSDSWFRFICIILLQAFTGVLWLWPMVPLIRWESSLIMWTQELPILMRRSKDWLQEKICGHQVNGWLKKRVDLMFLTLKLSQLEPEETTKSLSFTVTNGSQAPPTAWCLLVWQKSSQKVLIQSPKH